MDIRDIIDDPHARIVLVKRKIDRGRVRAWFDKVVLKLGLAVITRVLPYSAHVDDAQGLIDANNALWPNPPITTVAELSAAMQEELDDFGHARADWLWDDISTKESYAHYEIVTYQGMDAWYIHYKLNDGDITHTGANEKACVSAVARAFDETHPGAKTNVAYDKKHKYWKLEIYVPIAQRDPPLIPLDT